MNITMDTFYSTQNVEGTGSTISYTAAAISESERTWGSGCTLDIADKVMENNAYQGQGMTTQDIMQQAETTNVEAQKDFMLVMSNSVSGEDLAKMKEEGYDAGSTDVETYVSIVDQIKVTLAKAGVNIAGYTDDIDMNVLQEIAGGAVNANALVQQMLAADLPITQENMESISAAISQATQLGELSADAMKYLVLNHKSATIGNVYLAQFSAANTTKQAQGYYSDTAGYYAKKADSYNWANLQKQINATVEKAGLADHEKAFVSAKWLVEMGIELNPQNLQAVTALSDLQLPMDTEEAMELVIEAMKNGKAPMNTLLTGEESIAEHAATLVEETNQITDEAISQVVMSGLPVNLKNLIAAQKEIDANNNTTKEQPATVITIDSNSSLREIEVKRQLEEIRLMMTEEANRRMLKSGYQIDTTELSKLVEDLKSIEASMKSALFKGENAAVNQQRAVIYEETLAKTKALASMPVAVIGKAIAEQKPFTIGALHEEGTALQKQYEEAGKSYEVLMTEVRGDLGDSIKKAFRNVDDILNDMNLELNDSNRRAVRILGYNSMEITEENIEKVKEADSMVTGVIRRMTPATTLEMIRNQTNPLEMSVEELDNYLNQQDRDLGTDAEKFAKYLQKLDRKHEITEKEREAYIGIYRMFRQIEKSDGAVIGSLVSMGAELNFKNMLSAVRTRADKGMDLRIDDAFGGLEDLIHNGTAIDEQIMNGFQESNTNEQSDDMTEQKQKYYARLASEIKSEMTPEALSQMTLSAETTIEQFADNLKKQEVPNQEQESLKEELKTFQKDISKAAKVEDEVIQALIDFEPSVSVDNIEAAKLLMMERGSLFKQIFGKAKADVSADSEEQMPSSVEEAADEVIDSLTDKKSATDAYQTLIGEATKVAEAMMHEPGTTVLNIKAVKSLYKGLSLANNLAREENYEIPMEIGGELTSVNLKIYHNAAKSGKVAVTMETDVLGKVAAEFDVTDKGISGMMVYDKAVTKEALEQVKETMEIALGTNQKRVSLSLVHTKSIDLARFGEDRDVEAGEKLSTKELYHTAKTYMAALKGIGR